MKNKKLNRIKSSLESTVISIIKKEQDKLLSIESKIESLTKKSRELFEKQRVAKHPEYGEIQEERSELNTKLLTLREGVINQQNIVHCLENGGTLTSLKDKKDTEHENIPDYREVDTNEILFELDSILTAKKPPYIPNIDVDVFARKGYLFDAIRLDKDSYIVAIQGYFEKKENHYVLLTLDQLVLVNDYYYTRAKAKVQKEAADRNKSEEEYWDNLSEEKRASYLNQDRLYPHLPAKIKKEVTQEDWYSKTWQEKEKVHKFFKRHGAKRLTSKLESDKMWVSFHGMYERFIDPTAIPPKKGYGNPIVFEYWHEFREMMDYKIKDIKIQRTDLAESYQAALETSFGESNTSDILQKKYGILVKRQNGDKINPMEVEQIKNAFVSVQNLYGNLKQVCLKYNLKISHTGVRLVFAMKAIGVYIPSMGTIGVSDKYGNAQFESTMAHELAHFIDNLVGELNEKRWATDDYEGTAGRIAFIFRDSMNLSKKNHTDYTNATKECFARALQQYYGVEVHGKEAGVRFSDKPLDKFRPFFVADNFASEDAYYDTIKPLIEKFFKENKDVFKYTVDIDESNEPVKIGTEKEPKSSNDIISDLEKLRDVSESEENIKNLTEAIESLKVLEELEKEIMAKGGVVRRYNLPINDNYEIIDSYYTGGIEHDATTCENCGKMITNIAVIQNSEGNKYNVGLDCAETLSHVKGLYNVEMDFAELKSLRAKLNKYKKEGKDVNFKIYSNGDLFAEHDGRTIFNKDIEFSKKYLRQYLELVDNPEKIGFNYIDKHIQLPFERFIPKENKDFKNNFTLDGYDIEVSVKPYHHRVTGEISGYDYYVDIQKDGKNIYSRRITMYRNIVDDINYGIRTDEFSVYNNKNQGFDKKMSEGGEVEDQDGITANNWWRQTLSMNEHNELLTKYDEYFNKMESHKLYSPYNKIPYPSKELVVKMWGKEGSPKHSEFLVEQYGYGDLTNKDLWSKIREGKKMADGGVIETELKYNEVETGKPISFYSLHTINKEKTPHYGDRFGQNLEPKGKYISSVPNSNFKLEDNERASYNYGVTTFKNPLVVEFKNTSSTGWKKDLVDTYKKKGKSLSKHLIKLGYDGIITREKESGYVMEIISLQDTERIMMAEGGEIGNASIIIESGFPAIDEVLLKAKPMMDELAEKHKQYILDEGERYTKWHDELYRLGLIFDLTKALAKYLNKTDKLKNIDLTTDKGVITISANVDREGKEYYIFTKMIYAGGYNIQILHYRYIIDTNLPRVIDSGALENVKEYKKKLSKKERGLKEIEYLTRRINEENKLADDLEKLTPEELWESTIYKDWIWNPESSIKSQQEFDENMIKIKNEEVERNNRLITSSRMHVNEMKKSIVKQNKKLEDIKMSDGSQVHDFGCAMLYFDNPKMNEIHSQIDESDIYTEEGDDSFGLEDEHHTTLLYGLHKEVDDKDIFKRISNHSLPKTIKLVNVSLFENEKYDVLKFDVNEKILHEINKDLAELPNTNDYPDYHPHSTIGYIKKGKGKKYVKKFKGLTMDVFPEKIVYSKTDGSKQIKKLEKK